MILRKCDWCRWCIQLDPFGSWCISCAHTTTAVATTLLHSFITNSTLCRHCCICHLHHQKLLLFPLEFHSLSHSPLQHGQVMQLFPRFHPYGTKERLGITIPLIDDRFERQQRLLQAPHTGIIVQNYTFEGGEAQLDQVLLAEWVRYLGMGLQVDPRPQYPPPHPFLLLLHRFMPIFTIGLSVANSIRIGLSNLPVWTQLAV